MLLVHVLVTLLIKGVLRDNPRGVSETSSVIQFEQHSKMSGFKTKINAYNSRPNSDNHSQSFTLAQRAAKNTIFLEDSPATSYMKRGSKLRSVLTYAKPINKLIAPFAQAVTLCRVAPS